MAQAKFSGSKVWTSRVSPGPMPSSCTVCSSMAISLVVPGRGSRPSTTSGRSTVLPKPGSSLAPTVRAVPGPVAKTRRVMRADAVTQGWSSRAASSPSAS